MRELRVWLHEWQGDEWGWNAWSLDYLGFATWAPTREEVLRRVHPKLNEYCEWLARHGEPHWTEFPTGTVEVVEEISGNELAFQDDLLPATIEEIERCRQLLEYTRRDLLATVEGLSDDVLDWDPPYDRFAPHAWWRTVRQILQHIAFTEIGYYLPSVGWEVQLDLGELRRSAWQELLLRSREETLRFLDHLRKDSDRVRLTQGDEVWTVRKVLRRLVWHERLHWKSIQRIIGDYARR